MTEPAIKTRVLTKVRRQFLYKTPPQDENQGQHADLIPTPEQFNQDTPRILVPALGVVETDRNIHAGPQFLNSSTSISNIRIDTYSKSRKVTLNLQLNENELLPWEYCTKRLESYGNLELATWASRIKVHRESHTKIMQTYLNMVVAEDPAISALLAAAKAEADQKRQELERSFAFKITMYASKDRISPVSVAYGEELLREMGHSVEGFTEWAKKHGIPKLFDEKSPVFIELSKGHMDVGNYQPVFFRNGPAYTVELYDKEDDKKEIGVKLVYSMEPTPEGFFGYIYIMRIDNREVNDKRVRENKCVRKEDTDSDDSNASKETVEASQCDSESDQ